jgi:hypothetical protein
MIEEKIVHGLKCRCGGVMVEHYRDDTLLKARCKDCGKVFCCSPESYRPINILDGKVMRS